MANLWRTLSLQKGKRGGLCAMGLTVFTLNKLSSIPFMAFFTPINRNGIRKSSTLSTLAMPQSYWPPSFWNVALSILHMCALGVRWQRQSGWALGCLCALLGSGLLGGGAGSTPALPTWGPHRACLSSGHYSPFCEAEAHFPYCMGQQRKAHKV